jgi:hypothetical protein
MVAWIHREVSAYATPGKPYVAEGPIDDCEIILHLRSAYI